MHTAKQEQSPTRMAKMTLEKLYENSGRWKAHEDERLLALCNRGWSSAAIGEDLKRSPFSVQVRYLKLNRQAGEDRRIRPSNSRFDHVYAQQRQATTTTRPSRTSTQKRCRTFVVDAYCVYIIISTPQEIYIGYSSDVARRLAQHNSNEGAIATRGRSPWHLIYLETTPSKMQALAREGKLIAQCRKRDFEYLIAKAIGRVSLAGSNEMWDRVKLVN